MWHVLSLDQANWAGLDLRDAKMDQIDASGANFARTNFAGAVLDGRFHAYGLL